MGVRTAETASRDGIANDEVVGRNFGNCFIELRSFLRLFFCGLTKSRGHPEGLRFYIQSIPPPLSLRHPFGKDCSDGLSLPTEIISRE